MILGEAYEHTENTILQKHTQRPKPDLLRRAEGYPARPKLDRRFQVPHPLPGLTEARPTMTMHDDDDKEYDELLSILLPTKCQSVVVDQLGEFNVCSSRHGRVVLGIIERSVRATRRSSAVHRCLIPSCGTPATTIRASSRGCLASMVARRAKGTGGTTIVAPADMSPHEPAYTCVAHTTRNAPTNCTTRTYTIHVHQSVAASVQFLQSLFL